MDTPPVFTFTYTNWEGETAERRVAAGGLMRWGSTPWHPEPQWLFSAYDFDKKDYRDFAFKDMKFGDTTKTEASFQHRVHTWMMVCFNDEIAFSKAERNHRFLEEAVELVQSMGCTLLEALQVVVYVYGREKGDPVQEVGGVEVCLAALCTAAGISKRDAAETELARISAPEMVEKIRAKHAAKPKFSPLPGYSPPTPGDRGGGRAENNEGDTLEGIIVSAGADRAAACA